MEILFKSEEKQIEGEDACFYMQVEKEGEKFILSQVIHDDGNVVNLNGFLKECH